MISDDSGCGNSFEIGDTSSSNPNRKKRRINLPYKEPHSNHPVHQYQASHSASNLSQESGCLVQGLLSINETKEPELSDNLHLETAMMSIGDATSGGESHETCHKVAAVAASSIFCRYYLDAILLLTHLSAYR